MKKVFDSIQIRIWYGGSFTEERLVSLINENKKWVAEISKLNSLPNPDYKKQSASPDYYFEEYLPTRTVEFRTPKSGWRTFINRLFELNILTLPDETAVASAYLSGAPTDGWGVTVEIATRKIYRLYGYGNPNSYYKEIQEARDINQILILIDEEFGLNKIGNYINNISQNIDESDTVKPVKIDEIQLQDIKPEKKKKKK